MQYLLGNFPLHLNDLEIGNSVTRTDASCKFGGEKLKIIVMKPKDQCNIIIGVDLTLSPYIPSQKGEKSQFLPEIKVKAKFGDQSNYLRIKE